MTNDLITEKLTEIIETIHKEAFLLRDMGGRQYYPNDSTKRGLAQLQLLMNEARVDEWEWIRQHMPYTDQGALFEARAAKRLAALNSERTKREDGSV